MFNWHVPKTIKRSETLNFEVAIIICGFFLMVLAPRWWLVDAGSDDLLYVRQALSIKSGDWLGDFASGGGLKLPGFPIFLAIFSITKLPFYLGVFAIQIIGAFLVRDYFKKCFRGTFYKTIFAFCVLTPAMYGANNSRLLREGFYSALLIVLFGLSLRLFLKISKKTDSSLKNFFWTIISFATVSTWIAFTREETLAFILFDLILITLASLIASWNSQGILIAIKIITICILFLGCSSIAIKNLNEKYYKTSSVSFIQSGPLVELIDQWSRVKPVPTNPRILISAEQRDLIYSKIPRIGAKKSTLENYLGWYANASCAQAAVCDEIGSSWIFWGIFYGITVGEARSDPTNFNQEVHLMTKEIKSFCQLKPARCDSSFRIPTIGTPHNVLPIMATVPVDLINSLSQVGNSDPIPPSSGNNGNVEIFRQLTPVGGPPLNWSNQPIGHGATSNLAGLICMILLFGSARSIVEPSNVKRSVKVLIAPMIFVTTLLLFRLSVTSVMSVMMGNISHTNYSLPSNVLSWILLSQIPLLIALSKILRAKRVINSR